MQIFNEFNFEKNVCGFWPNSISKKSMRILADFDFEKKRMQILADFNFEKSMRILPIRMIVIVFMRIFYASRVGYGTP